jgi:hypothetical protein
MHPKMSIFQTILRDAVCTWFLQFSSLKCQVWLTWFFFPSLIWIFLPTIVCKIQVWNGLKIKFIKLEISNWKIADRQGDKVVLQLIESWANFWAATFWVWIFYLILLYPAMSGDLHLTNLTYCVSDNAVCTYIKFITTIIYLSEVILEK